MKPLYVSWRRPSELDVVAVSAGGTGSEGMTDPVLSVASRGGSERTSAANDKSEGSVRGATDGASPRTSFMSWSAVPLADASCFFKCVIKSWEQVSDNSAIEVEGSFTELSAEVTSGL